MKEMKIGKLLLIGAIFGVATVVTGIAGAQTLQQAVDDALNQNGPIISRIASQKQLSTQDHQLIAVAQRDDDGDRRGHRCDRDRGFPLPGGPWVNSCKNYRIERGILSATCLNGDNQWAPAETDLCSCRKNRLINASGFLTCEPD
jgi:hypothetical protein